MKWNEKVKMLMQEQNINQKQLSEKSGITEPSVCRYLKGERNPRIDIIINFAKAFNVSIEYLLDESLDVYSPTNEIKTAIARHGNELSKEEQEELVELIKGEKFDV